MSTAVLLACLLPLLVPVPAPAAQTSPAGDSAQPTSGDEMLDNAVAAVVVSALTERMGDQAVSVQLDSIDVAVSSASDRIVSGQGRMRIGNDEDWVGFRYRTVYDTTLASAGYPELSIGGVGADEREVPNDAALVQQLQARVEAELGTRPGGRAARLQLDRITTVEGGRRFLRIDAFGLADFGLDGSTPLRIEALYDRTGEAWQRVDYQLGTAAGPR